MSTAGVLHFGGGRQLVRPHGALHPRAIPAPVQVWVLAVLGAPGQNGARAPACTAHPFLASPKSVFH